MTNDLLPSYVPYPSPGRHAWMNVERFQAADINLALQDDIGCCAVHSEAVAAVEAAGERHGARVRCFMHLERSLSSLQGVD